MSGVTPFADDPGAVRWLARAIGVTFTAGLLGLFIQGADRPADPYLRPAPAETAATSVP